MSGQVIWITGLSGAGKTTLADELITSLKQRDLRPILLDGDILRKLLQVPHKKNNSHTRETRIKLALKYAQMCKLLASQGFTVMIATISMFDEVYAWNRANLPKFFEIYLKVPLAELRSRDPKNIYQRHTDGHLENVAGLDLVVDQPYESNLTLDFETQPSIWHSPKSLADYVMSELQINNMV